MKRLLHGFAGWLASGALICVLAGGAAASALREPTPEDDFVVSEARIAMRDGVKLYTLVVRPKHATTSLPILLIRTPYDASGNLSARQVRLAAALGSRFAELDGYIFAFQDVRGRYGSEGRYELFRPLRGSFNDSSTDQTTDAWDTVDWLVKQVQGNSGRVGLIGTSYEAWLVLAALLDPHPAVKAAVPVNPMVDLWKGDDAFHNGAFRLGYMLDYVYLMEARPGSISVLPRDSYDLYTWWLKQGSPRDLQARYLPSSVMFAKLLNRPAYDSFWQDAAIDRRLASSGARRIATLHVHSWFDQEDAYGAPAAFAAMEQAGNALNFFTAGPWYHAQSWSKGARAGSLDWSEASGPRWRRDVLAPFLANYLKDGRAHGLPKATVFDTGARQWRRFETWPRVESGVSRNLYLQSHGKLGWHPDEDSSSSYVSDPGHPVPYQPRPIKSYYGDDTDREEWSAWQLADQRFVDGRPDVLSFVSEPLDAALSVQGEISARLFAAASGRDADWVVKLIDVFPDRDPFDAAMSGYQLMVSGDIMRARYRESPGIARPIPAGETLEYRIRLPAASHTFGKGHRLMVQVQSSWFPLYDRNPQDWVGSIMEARPVDLRIATHTVRHGRSFPSRIELRVTD